MKIYKSALLILTFCVLALSSCQKFAYDNEEKTDTGDAGMTFKLDGTLKKANWGSATTAVLISYAGINQMQITGQVSVSEGVSLLLINYNGVGEYSGDDVILVYLKNSFNPDSDSFLEESGGKVKITSATDQLIKGTFEFKGFNSSRQAVVISEGKFESKVTKMTMP